MSRWHTTEFDLLPELAFRSRGGRGKFSSMTLEGGGKGSSAPPPDPRLIAAQIKSLGIQDDMVQQILENSREMMPLQRDQLAFGLQSSKTAYDQSQEDRDWMLGRRGTLSKLQDRQASDAATFNTEDRADQLAGQAIGDVNQAFDTAQQSQQRNLTRSGVNPNDGKFVAASNQMTAAKALGQAQAATGARAAARQEGYALTDRASNALAGYPSLGMQATGAGAGFGANGLTLTGAGLAGMNSGFGMGGQMAGQMGSNATNMWSAQANYKLGADKLAADSDPFATLVGAGTKLAVANMAYSDRRLKRDIVMVGKDDRTGLNLYEYRYADGKKRFRGVMADEVEQVNPEAVIYDKDGYAAVNYGLLGIDMVEVA